VLTYRQLPKDPAQALKHFQRSLANLRSYRHDKLGFYKRERVAYSSLRRMYLDGCMWCRRRMM